VTEETVCEKTYSRGGGQTYKRSQKKKIRLEKDARSGGVNRFTVKMANREVIAGPHREQKARRGGKGRGGKRRARSRGKKKREGRVIGKKKEGSGGGGGVGGKG